MAEHGPDTLGQETYHAALTRAVGGALRVIIGLSVLILVFAGAACGRAYWLAQRWSRAFNSVAVGDSRALVEQAMGGRGEHGDCPGAARVVGSAVAGETCVSRIVYMPVPMFEWWTFEFDRNDRVLRKYYTEFD